MSTVYLNLDAGSDVEITVRENEDKTIRINVTDYLGAVIDLTNSPARCYVSPLDPRVTPIIFFDETDFAMSNGYLDWDILASKTLGKAGKYSYDLLLVYQNENVYLLKGDFIINPSITR